MSFAGIDVDDDPRYTTRGALHVPAGEGIEKWVNGSGYTMKVTRASTKGSVGFVEATVAPGGGPMPHAHRNEDEIFYMLGGELEFLDGDRTFIAGPGDFIFVPRNHRHRFTNVSSDTARMLFLFTPGGPEHFFVEAGDDPVPGGQPGVWEMERVMGTAHLAEQVGMDLLPDRP